MKKSALDLTTIGLFVLGLGYFFWPTLVSIHAHWSQVSASYSHGYLLLLTSIYLFYEARTRKSVANTYQNWLLFAIPLLGFSIIWLLAELVQIQIIQQLSILAITYFFLATIFGIQGAKDAIFPVGLILLAIPIWGSILHLLQYITVLVCTFGLSLLNIPAHIHEFYIQIPDGVIHVADSCSGLNYFLIAVSLGVIQAQLYCHSIFRRILLTLFAATIGLISNWIRVFSLIVIGHVTKMQSPLLESHFWHGWIIFGISLIPIFIIANKLRDDSQINSQVTKVENQNQSDAKASLLISGFALLLAFSGPIALKSFTKSLTNFHESSFSEKLAEWRYQISANTDWTPNYMGADKIISGSLKKDFDSARLNVYLYLDQHQGKELVYYKNSITNDQWKQTQEHGTSLSDTPVIVAHLVSRHRDREKAVIYWYQVGDTATNNKNKVKFLQLRNFLQGRSDAALIALSTDCAENCEEAFKFLGQLVTPLKSAYSAALGAGDIKN